VHLCRCYDKMDIRSSTYEAWQQRQKSVDPSRDRREGGDVGKLMTWCCWSRDPVTWFSLLVFFPRVNHFLIFLLSGHHFSPVFGLYIGLSDWDFCEKVVEGWGLSYKQSWSQYRSVRGDARAHDNFTWEVLYTLETSLGSLGRRLHWSGTFQCPQR
jgi:hypothetical protein